MFIQARNGAINVAAVQRIAWRGKSKYVLIGAEDQELGECVDPSNTVVQLIPPAEPFDLLRIWRDGEGKAGLCDPEPVVAFALTIYGIVQPVAADLEPVTEECALRRRAGGPVFAYECRHDSAEEWLKSFAQINGLTVEPSALPARTSGETTQG